VGGVPYAFQTLVWTPRFLLYPDVNYRHGWQKPFTQFPRDVRNEFPLTTFRLMAEMNIMGDQRGFGRLGADFWPVIKDRKGRAVGTVSARYPKTRWRNLTIATSILAPGPQGALSTARLEMIREGVEECEARIFVEQALLDEVSKAKLGPQLVDRAKKALEERTRAIEQGLSSHSVCGFHQTNVHGWHGAPGRVGYQWYLGSGWQRRSDELYAVASEISRALGK
jgi:hypothetical protein